MERVRAVRHCGGGRSERSAKCRAGAGASLVPPQSHDRAGSAANVSLFTLPVQSAPSAGRKGVDIAHRIGRAGGMAGGHARHGGTARRVLLLLLRRCWACSGVLLSRRRRATFGGAMDGDGTGAAALILVSFLGTITTRTTRHCLSGNGLGVEQRDDNGPMGHSSMDRGHTRTPCLPFLSFQADQAEAYTTAS